MTLQNPVKPVRLFCDSTEPENCDYDLPPIVLLHGLCAINTTWNKVKNEIADGTQRQVFSVDLRNHGQSEWSKVSSLAAMIQDLVLFFSIRNIKKAIIIGHSLGGRLGIAFALKKPEMVAKLIVEDAYVKNPTEEVHNEFLKAINSLKKLRMLPRDVSEKEIHDLFVRIMQLSFPKQKLNKDTVMVPFHRDADGSFHFDFNIDVLEKAMRDKSLYLINNLQTISLPALFMYGEHSVSTTQEDTLIPETFPHSKMHCMENCAHMPHLEKPEEFAKIVCRFINDSH